MVLSAEGSGLSPQSWSLPHSRCQVEPRIVRSTRPGNPLGSILARQEIGHLVDQMTEDERRAYFVESLFLNTVTYENEKLGAFMRKLAGR